MVWELWGGSGELWGSWRCKIIGKSMKISGLGALGVLWGCSGELWGSWGCKIIEKSMKINGLGALGVLWEALGSSGECRGALGV